MTMYLCCKGTVSIHTSTWEVTKVSLNLSLGSSFNPHLHVGGDNKATHINVMFSVSIHTSTWEVTCKVVVTLLLP